MNLYMGTNIILQRYMHPYLCSLQHYSQWPRHRNNWNVSERWLDKEDVAHVYSVCVCVCVCVLALGSRSQAHFSLTALKTERNVWKQYHGLLVRFVTSALELFFKNFLKYIFFLILNKINADLIFNSSTGTVCRTSLIFCLLFTTTSHYICERNAWDPIF